MAYAFREGGLFRLNTINTGHSALLTSVDTQLWHERLGHISAPRLKQMMDMVKGMDIASPLPPKFECVACAKGKAHHKNISKDPAIRASAPLERVHSDICGPMRTPSHGKARYFLTLVDDHTRFGWVYFLKNKDDLTKTFEEWHKKVTTQSGQTVKSLRSDNGGEYIGKHFQAVIKKHGITHERAAPYTPQHNGVAERRNLTLEELARCMLQHAGLGDEFWAEAIYYANCIANLAPTKAVKDITPYEAWHGNAPSVADLHVFGCRALTRVQTDDIGKFDP